MKYQKRLLFWNIDRFPTEFMFRLSEKEWTNLKYQFGTSSSEHGGRRTSPFVFTEQGVAMLSAVLRSETAVKQYPAIEIKEFKNAHDRFIIIDNISVYHFGASLKDLGKKWFAFSKMDIGAVEMITKLGKDR